MHEKTKILFVDNDLAFLAALKRRLSPFQPAWDMRFESSAEAALKYFEYVPFDVLVTDLEMPRIGGSLIANLLGSMPNAPAIIILTGEASREGADRQLCVPFQYLAKPCDPVSLVKAVTHARQKSLSQISTLYDQVLEIVVHKMRQHGLLHTDELPLEYATLLGIRHIADLLGDNCLDDHPK
ncbi:hypothetical protein GCM10011332_06000 [Terasakiella brassicae]|uniref:Response regulatory domain-containing protein n=1 Tax=Terasakiella brassicae TaxID=1634917 RepID=A0A917BS43_9PROT|nr:response regulator [Terasakiella brassicae]GGF55403.1 hypothetical protein GCM10011332_06000 [Terasakiella brassicae]